MKPHQVNTKNYKIIHAVRTLVMTNFGQKLRSDQFKFLPYIKFVA